MFQQKKKEKISYKLYWERMLGYNYDTEFAIYNFLSDKKVKSKIMKKVPANKQFDTYFAWENYVRSLYSNAPLGELKEFKKYLNNKSRSNNNHTNLTNNILIPITITIISLVITPLIFVITNNYSILNNLRLSNVFIKVALLVIIFPVLLSLLICFILKMVSLASEAFLDTKQEEFYYNDYMKIINQILEERV
jgi:hypothetical protein